MSSPHKVIFMGTPEFAIPSLKGLIEARDFDVVAVVTQPDRPAGRSGKPQPSPVKELAEKSNVPVFTPEKIKNNAELLDKLRALQPEVMVVVAYGKILPQEVLDIPPKGIVNVHASLLPKHRGAAPIAGSILAGDKGTGVTIMQLVLEMDAGPIIAYSSPVAINQYDTTGTLTPKLAELGAAALIESLPKYLAGEILLQAQDEAEATYVKMIKKEDGKIDWQDPAEKIERQVRAYTPWPSAFSWVDDNQIKILESEVVPEAVGTPGRIWQTPDRYPAVTTSQGSLKLISVQLAGKKPTSGRDFLMGRPNLVDSTLS